MAGGDGCIEVAAMCLHSMWHMAHLGVAVVYERFEGAAPAERAH